MLSKYISWQIFLGSFILGLAFIFIVGPETKTVFIYPSPDIYTKILYKDDAGTCFKITPKETKCPLNPFSVTEFPVQTTTTNSM